MARRRRVKASGTAMARTNITGRPAIPKRSWTSGLPDPSPSQGGRHTASTAPTVSAHGRSRTARSTLIQARLSAGRVGTRWNAGAAIWFVGINEVRDLLRLQLTVRLPGSRAAATRSRARPRLRRPLALLLSDPGQQ